MLFSPPTPAEALSPSETSVPNGDSFILSSLVVIMGNGGDHVIADRPTCGLDRLVFLAQKPRDGLAERVRIRRPLQAEFEFGAVRCEMQLPFPQTEQAGRQGIGQRPRAQAGAFR
jgi:hypothetical protein